LRVLAKVPRWTGHYGGGDKGWEMLEAANELSQELDIAISDAWSTGKKPGKRAVRKVEKKTKVLESFAIGGDSYVRRGDSPRRP